MPESSERASRALAIQVQVVNSLALDHVHDISGKRAD